jgi:hypothetical protein
MSDGLTLAPTADVASVESALYRTYAATDNLRVDLDRLVLQVERLLRERRHITDVLTQFYRSDISISSLQPVLALCTELNPSLKEAVRR